MAGISRSLGRAVVVFVCLAVPAGRVGAQSVSGSISGTVVDQSHQVVPGATVTLIDEQTGRPADDRDHDDTGAFVLLRGAAGPLHGADRDGGVRHGRADSHHAARRTSGCRSGPSSSAVGGADRNGHDRSPKAASSRPTAPSARRC